MPRKAVKPVCLTPPIALLCKIGSVVVHTEEFLSPSGHPFDRTEIERLLRDPDIIAWVKEMHMLALLPIKR